jgi:DNA repair exonuclease SbcCD ATPase subunit
MNPNNRLVAIELEAFRGFATTQRLDLDAEVVIVRGDNGTGKTSITDGLLWLITGTLPRLAERTKGYRKGKDPLVNGYREGRSARVQLTVRMGDGQLINVERSGNWSDSTVRAWDSSNAPVEPMDSLAAAFGISPPARLGEAVSSWGILQQHSVLAALDKGETLHERMADIVGLDRVTKFTTAARATSAALRAEWREHSQALASLRDRRKATALALQEAEVIVTGGGKRPLAIVMDASLKRLPEGIGARQTPGQLDEVAALGREVTAAVAGVEGVVARADEAQDLDTSSAGAVDELELQLSQLMEHAQKTIARAPVQVQMATAALDLIGDTCPVCGKSVDEASVREHLNELLQEAHAAAEGAVRSQREVASAQAALSSARSALARLTAAREALDGAVGAVRELLDSAVWLDVDRRWRSAERSAELYAALVDLQTRLREIYADARRDADADVARLTADLATQDLAIERAQDALSAVEERAVHARRLEDATRTAAQRIVERALERLGPSFAEVYDRLSPHPTFRVLRATQDIYYNKNQVLPEVWDPVRKVGGPPSVVLSEGQLNVVALSYFLGLALNAGNSALPFIVLDDPLQSMDVVSVLGFADFCRRLRTIRQMIVTTHDRRFASLLTRKLTPREAGSRTVLHEFAGWTADGPELRTVDQPLAEIVPLLERRTG